MRELRKDPVTQRWVIISTGRKNRPHQFSSGHPEIPDDRENCPFCEGREYLTPPEVFSYRSRESKPDDRGWDVRVIPDKDPMLDPSEPMKKYGIGMFDAMRGTGAHELVLETPRHRQQWSAVTTGQIAKIINTFRLRMLGMRQDPNIQYVMIAKNHGVAAGAFLHHPHSHVVGLPIVPKKVQEELEGAGEYYEYKERCVYCDMVTQELNERVRLVASTDRFLALCPFASRFPFEIWLMPKDHAAHFEHIGDEDALDLARIMKTCQEKLGTILNGPPFNLFLHTSPFSNDHDDYYHWHLELIPKLTKEAGFEWGSGFYINPTIPEEAAKILRENDVKRYMKEG